ncbi:hypothetical protein HHK36_008202 [Tetracentron sinense]|uniref:non-specific serine/threonine protein kinase n=1 Tax=Tetracentron sinense TaxID=13715 RepID=A0A834ZG52_TETSI|nr:hypothetical protein HHK36_008202 [Tetracentron sinense]
MLDPPYGGDGIAFFLTHNGSHIPANSLGGCLALFGNCSEFSSSGNAIVAVEFETYEDVDWDPSDNHVGININSIRSVANLTWGRSMSNGSIVDAWITYNSSTQNLSVFLTYLDNPIFSGNSRLSYQVDLTKVLPEWVTIGVSASTGQRMQAFVGVQLDGVPFEVTWVGHWTGGWFGCWWICFEEGKLGQGGFGAVYRGILTDSNLNVAVKVSIGSEQGRKESISEVKIISRLRHRNLVQLMGWCHERGEFLLVYEFMPNNSFDSHLFGGKNMLSWGLRYKIALGLASALFYLHEEWEECVVPRDIKSSNVMLDSNFNTKLGDFGLARLMDHEHGPKTTALAGTLGYMAPEYISTGKASKESDVFSFGVVALEIACGRKSIEPRKESQVSLVAWVWELYGRESLFDAADERLCVDYDMKQMEHLMIVGLWCAHPDYSLRPSIRQAIQVINFEGPLPNLPTNMPVPIHSFCILQRSHEPCKLQIRVTQKLNYSGHAYVDASDGVIQLTRNRADVSLTYSIGRAVFAEEVQLWDSATGTVADFNTHFSFNVSMLYPPNGGDGIAFFLTHNGSHIPANSSGGCLALFGNSSDFCSSGNAIVAVEFDTFEDNWDPSDNHVGININSIRSVANLTWGRSMSNGSIVDAWITYNSSTQNLSVFLTYLDNPIFSGNSRLSYQVDLTKVLPEWVTIGFSASTGRRFQIHNILSWEFNSTEFPLKSHGLDTGPVVGLAVGGSVLVSGVGLVLFVWWKKRISGKEEEDMAFDMSMNSEFDNGKGPKRFSYGELVRATNNFAEEGKLGQGGFGAVYRGVLTDNNLNVAVKVSKGSEQGRKEYISEVKIISRLRHRNLVQLMGWCHERGEFLLVYEFMPNRSLDSHLFGGKNILSWGFRYKISLGLASALLYLHEEWEECVVHRDIKSSNVMLDSNFNTKLGDFGLARLMDHEHGPKTTALAGTLGYMAPEYISTGKASKESDVFSFGVVALEIACGRKSIEPKKESQVSLVAWVWELYGREILFDATDERLCMDYDSKQMEHLMIVGLWCAHPDYSLRPSIRQAIQVLNFEQPLPNLPTIMPVPMYHVPSPSVSSTEHLLSVQVLQ